MANVQRDLAKEGRWREAVSRQASSGLSVREFCRREGLIEPGFYTWRRTIRERDGGVAAAFLPVVVSDRPSGGSTGDASICLDLAGGRCCGCRPPLVTATPAYGAA